MRSLLKSAVPLALLLMGQLAQGADVPVRPRLEDYSSYAEFLNAMTDYQRKLRGGVEAKTIDGAPVRPSAGTVSDLDLATVQAATGGKKVELQENAGLDANLRAAPINKPVEDLETAVQKAQLSAAQDTIESPTSQLTAADSTELASLVVEGALDSTAAGESKAPVTSFQKAVDNQEQGDQPKRQNRNSNNKKKSLQSSPNSAKSDITTNSVGATGALTGATIHPNASVSIQVRN